MGRKAPTSTYVFISYREFPFSFDQEAAAEATDFKFELHRLKTELKKENAERNIQGVVAALDDNFLAEKPCVEICVHLRVCECLSVPECVVCTTLAISLYAVKNKVHLMTRNVQITAYKPLNTWYGPPGPQSRHASFWAWIRRGYGGTLA